MDIATAERNRLGLGDGPPGNLREHLESEVGLRIFYFPMPSKIAGAFAYNEDLGACIGINSRHPRDRRQWSLAHEYGHFLVNRFRAELTVLETRHLNAGKERITDAFTENFLMPPAGLNRRFSEIHRSSSKGVTLADIVGLANLYRVSVQALVLRLETLKGCRREPGSGLSRRGLKSGKRSNCSALKRSGKSKISSRNAMWPSRRAGFAGENSARDSLPGSCTRIASPRGLSLSRFNTAFTRKARGISLASKWTCFRLSEAGNAAQCLNSRWFSMLRPS